MADPGPVKAEPVDSLKTEQDDDATTPLGHVPAAVDDEDLYEDAGDLEFYETGEGLRFDQMYLARVPKYVWDAWHRLTERLGDNDEIQIGTLRTWQVPGPNPTDTTTPKLKLLLQANVPEHQALPREYEFDITSTALDNHYIFSEENLPGYKARSKARADAASAGIPLSLLRSKEPAGGQKPTYERRSRYQPYYRKAIPKKTKIIGKAQYDVRAEPVDHEEEERFLAQQLFDEEHNKTSLQIISRNTASNISNPGTVSAVNWAGKNFIKNTPQLAKPRKGEIFKAARIPKNQLLDLIFDCFRQYQYWSMKALRQKTAQPDSYLRQVLEEVAMLIKSGPFANHYCLTEAYQDKAGSESKKEAAAEAADDGDEDEEEMEDVLPS